MLQALILESLLLPTRLCPRGMPPFPIPLVPPEKNLWLQASKTLQQGLSPPVVPWSTSRWHIQPLEQAGGEGRGWEEGRPEGKEASQEPHRPL